MNTNVLTLSNEPKRLTKSSSIYKKEITDYIIQNKKKHIKKGDFCKKYNITSEELEKVLIEQEYIRIRQIGGYSQDDKRAIMRTVTSKGQKHIFKLSGTWQKGTYFYDEKHFLQFFINFSEF